MAAEILIRTVHKPDEEPTYISYNVYHCSICGTVGQPDQLPKCSHGIGRMQILTSRHLLRTS